MNRKRKEGETKMESKLKKYENKKDRKQRKSLCSALPSTSVFYVPTIIFIL